MGRWTHWRWKEDHSEEETAREMRRNSEQLTSWVTAREWTDYRRKQQEFSFTACTYDAASSQFAMRLFTSNRVRRKHLYVLPKISLAWCNKQRRWWSTARSLKLWVAAATSCLTDVPKWCSLSLRLLKVKSKNTHIWMPERTGGHVALWVI